MQKLDDLGIVAEVACRDANHDVQIKAIEKTQDENENIRKF